MNFQPNHLLVLDVRRINSFVRNQPSYKPASKALRAKLPTYTSASYLAEIIERKKPTKNVLTNLCLKAPHRQMEARS